MFKILLLAACVAVVAAKSPYPDVIVHHNEPIAETEEYTSDVRPDGFEYSVETSNTISQHAKGDEHGNIVGSYDYVAPDNSHVLVTYIANEYGYQPNSDLLPTPPPIPAAILKSLEYLRTHAKEELPKARVL